jgi:carotenoid cleavage dioxygenase-like enzyme
MSALPEATFAPTAAAGGRTRGFFSGAREIDDAAVRVEGTLPGWLRGVLLQGGPALWELPRGALQHWFDGYAMWHRWRFDGTAAVRYRSRFADSASYRGSRQAQRPVSGEFGSPNPHGLLARLRGAPPTDNPAVAISRHGERWIAVSETPYLTVFDPDTLATLARLDLRYDDAPMHLMAAHGFSLDDGSYLNVGVTIGRECRLRLFRLRPGAPRPDVLGEVRTARPGYLHGFALAPGHAVVWDCALRLQPIAMRFGAGSYAGNFRWEPGGGPRCTRSRSTAARHAAGASRR